MLPKSFIDVQSLKTKVSKPSHDRVNLISS